MKEFFEAIALSVLVASALAVCFIFQGSPDLWDVWHEQAMAAARSKP